MDQLESQGELEHANVDPSRETKTISGRPRVSSRSTANYLEARFVAKRSGWISDTGTTSSSEGSDTEHFTERQRAGSLTIRRGSSARSPQDELLAKQNEAASKMILEQQALAKASSVEMSSGLLRNAKREAMGKWKESESRRASGTAQGKDKIEPKPWKNSKSKYGQAKWTYEAKRRLAHEALMNRKEMGQGYTETPKRS